MIILIDGNKVCAIGDENIFVEEGLNELTIDKDYTTFYAEWHTTDDDEDYLSIDIPLDRQWHELKSDGDDIEMDELNLESFPRVEVYHIRYDTRFHIYRLTDPDLDE